jgi:hypothetical protein
MGSMPIVLLGESGGGTPFGRSFFNSAFEPLVHKLGKDAAKRLLLYISDGTIFEVAQIEELAENYLVVRGYKGDEDAAEQSIQVLPYGLIYRLELGSQPESGTRVGFKWAPPGATRKK